METKVLVNQKASCQHVTAGARNLQETLLGRTQLVQLN